MENNKKLSTRSITALIILGLLTGFGLFVAVFMVIKSRTLLSSGALLSLIAYAITSLLLLYYALTGYKIPHGNLLKYLFLAFAACCLSGVVSTSAENATTLDNVYNISRGIVVLMTGYVAGRLERFRKNVILMSIIGILMLISSVAVTTFYSDVLGILYCFTFFILWVDLMIAYIVRYKEHKEAGLEDKK